jgi:hypothetical protein
MIKSRGCKEEFVAKQDLLLEGKVRSSCAKLYCTHSPHSSKGDDNLMILAWCWLP